MDVLEDIAESVARIGAEAAAKYSDEDSAPCPDGQHRWKGQRMGGSPDMAESYEWVEYCDVCGIERPCED